MSGYREDEHALRSKVSELEGELARAKAEIGRLRGEAAGPSAGAGRSRVLDAPLGHVREVTLPHTLTDDGYVAIARILRARLARSATQVGGDLSGPGFTLTREAGSTHLRVSADFAASARSVVVATFLSFLLPGVPIVGALADVANHGGPHSLPFHALWLVPSVAIAIGAWARSRARSHVAEETAKIDGAFEAMLDAAKEHAVKADAPVKARVETAEEADDEAAAEAEREVRGRA